MTVTTTIDQPWSFQLFILSLPDALTDNPWAGLCLALLLLWAFMILFFRGLDRGERWGRRWQ